MKWSEANREQGIMGNVASIYRNISSDVNQPELVPSSINNSSYLKSHNVSEWLVLVSGATGVNPGSSRTRQHYRVLTDTSCSSDVIRNQRGRSSGRPHRAEVPPTHPAADEHF